MMVKCLIQGNSDLSQTFGHFFKAMLCFDFAHTITFPRFVGSLGNQFKKFFSVRCLKIIYT